jgi:hypothetical protein
MESKLALNELLERYAAVEHGNAPGVRQSSSNLVRGFASLPLRFVEG